MLDAQTHTQLLREDEYIIKIEQYKHRPQGINHEPLKGSWHVAQSKGYDSELKLSIVCSAQSFVIIPGKYLNWMQLVTVGRSNESSMPGKGYAILTVL